MWHTQYTFDIYYHYYKGAFTVINYNDEPNLLLEALAYLGRRASGSTWNHMEERIRYRHIKMNSAFQEQFSRLKTFTKKVDKQLALDEKDFSPLFSNLDGLPANTVGSASIAFTLFYPALEHFDGDFEAIVESLKANPPDEIARGIALVLDFTDDSSGQEPLTASKFMQLVLAQSLPDSTKVSILDTYNQYTSLIDEAAFFLKPVIRILSQEYESLKRLVSFFTKDLSSLGYPEFLAQMSHLKFDADASYLLRPFVFGMDTNIGSDIVPQTLCLYCGILRRDLSHMLSESLPSAEDVYNVYHVLGDKTRFDILCYLRGRKAYGQELSNYFNLSRNTIHHHMNKLVNSNMVQCTMEGNRVYYFLNQDALHSMVHRQYELFCDEQD